MLKKMMIALMGLAVFAVVPAFAAIDCKKGGFFGSYTRSDPNFDVFGDGTTFHSLVFQLTLHTDGTANEFWTGLPDYTITLGTGSPWIGSWTCRSDGKLVVTMINGSYTPVTGTDPNTGNPTPDIALFRTSRTTYLFTIDDANTLTRTESRARRYTPAQDPTDPSGGTLAALNTTSFVYKRLTASDADLLAP